MPVVTKSGASTSTEDQPSTPSTAQIEQKDIRLEIYDFVNCIAIADSVYLKKLQDARFELYPNSEIFITDCEYYIKKRIEDFVEYLTDNEDVFKQYVNHYYLMIAALTPVNHINRDDYNARIELIKKKYQDFLVRIYYKTTLDPYFSTDHNAGQTRKIQLKVLPLTFSVYNGLCQISQFKDTIKLEKKGFNQRALSKLINFLNEVLKNSQQMFNTELFDCDPAQHERVYVELITEHKIYTISNFMAMLYSMTFPSDTRHISVYDKVNRMISHPGPLEDKLYYLYLLHVTTNLDNQRSTQED